MAIRIDEQDVIVHVQHLLTLFSWFSIRTHNLSRHTQVILFVIQVPVHFKMHTTILQTRDESASPYEFQAGTQSLCIWQLLKTAMSSKSNLNQNVASRIYFMAVEYGTKCASDMVLSERHLSSLHNELLSDLLRTRERAFEGLVTFNQGSDETSR